MQNYKVNQYATGIINDNTPVGALTVGQLREVMGLEAQESIVEIKPKPDKRYVYGLAGIRKLFNVSHATAQRYKDTIIKDAVMQQGRKIVVDADKALELFKEQQY